MQQKYLKTKKQFGEKRLTTIFESYDEFEDYMFTHYQEVSKHYDWNKGRGKNKKMTKKEVIESHKEYIFGIHTTLKEVSDWLEFKKDIDISRQTLQRYYKELDLITYESKQQRKHLEKKETISDDKIPNNALVIDDTHKTLFPVRNKYRGIINKGKETIVDIYDKSTGEIKRLPLSLEDETKKKQMKKLIKLILEKTDKPIAIDGELANSKDEIFGDERVMRYECEYIGSKRGGNTPMSKNYQIGESQHLPLKEGVYNKVNLLNSVGVNKGNIKNEFKETLNKIYESKLNKYTEVKEWIKKMD